MNRRFVHKLNYKLIFVHSLAGFFFIWAFNELIYLTDSDLLRIYDKIDIIDAWRLDYKIERIGKFLLLKYTGSYIGLIITFFISLSITIMRKLRGINSLIVLFASFIFIKLGVLTSDYIEQIVYFPGEFLFGFSFKSVTLNGILLLSVSIFIYFSKYLNKRIFGKDADEFDQETSF